MTFWVRNSEKKYGCFDEEDPEGNYKNWVAIIEPENPDEYWPIFIMHSETYYRDEDCWEMNKPDREISRPENWEEFVKEYRKVDESECSSIGRASICYYLPKGEKSIWEFERKNKNKNGYIAW